MRGDLNWRPLPCQVVTLEWSRHHLVIEWVHVLLTYRDSQIKQQRSSWDRRRPRLPVAKNQLRFIEWLEGNWLSWTWAGGDACGPRTIVHFKACTVREDSAFCARLGACVTYVSGNRDMILLQLDIRL